MPQTELTPAVREETLLTFQQVAARCSVNYATVTRWVRFGVKVNGAKIKLEAARMGGRYRTSVEALERFHAACDAPLQPAPTQARTPTQTKRAARQAESTLDRLFGPVTRGDK